MSDIQEARIWTENGAGDLTVAKHLIETLRPMPVEIICFHAQQAVEKTLKAIIAYNEEEIQKTHVIADIVERCNELGANIEVEEAVATALTKYAVVVRYRQDTRDFTEDDAKFAVKQAEKIIQDVEGYLTA
jgi:HEPN domain-containing protein